MYRKTPVRNCDFNKVDLKRFPVNLLLISRTSFPKNTSGGLLPNGTKFLTSVKKINKKPYYMFLSYVDKHL